MRFGEFCIIIEFCSGCHRHNYSLRHDEQKYLQKAIRLKSKILEEFPFMKIYLKPLKSEMKSAVKKLGLFEVKFASFEHRTWKLIGSKLKTLKWPNSRVIINNIR